MTFARLAASILLSAVLAAPAFAEDRGTEADQEACTPDVFRLCQELIPDEGKIVACLEAKGPQLSGACHRVMFSSPAPAAKPGRSADIASPAHHRSKMMAKARTHRRFAER